MTIPICSAFVTTLHWVKVTVSELMIIVKVKFFNWIEKIALLTEIITMIIVELRFSLPVKHLGLPKAVETSHRNVNSQIESINISSKFKHILTEEGIENPTTVIEIVASYSLTILSFQLSFVKWR